MLWASLRLFNRRILKGETRGVEIRGRELGADFRPSLVEFELAKQNILAEFGRLRAIKEEHAILQGDERGAVC